MIRILIMATLCYSLLSASNAFASTYKISVHQLDVAKRVQKKECVTTECILDVSIIKNEVVETIQAQFFFNASGSRVQFFLGEEKLIPTSTGDDYVYIPLGVKGLYERTITLTRKINGDSYEDSLLKFPVLKRSPKIIAQIKIVIEANGH